MDNPHEHHEPTLTPQVVERSPDQGGQGGAEGSKHQHGFSAEPTTEFTARHGTKHGDHENDTALGGVEFFLTPTQLLKEEEWENRNEDEGQRNDEANHDAKLGRADRKGCADITQDDLEITLFLGLFGFVNLCRCDRIVPREPLLTGSLTHEERHHHDGHQDRNLNQKCATNAHNANDGTETSTTDDASQGLGREHVAVDPLEFMGLQNIDSECVG